MKPGIITTNEDYSIVLGLNAAGDGVSFKTNWVNDRIKPTITRNENSFGQIAPWGEDNLFPQRLLKAIRKSPLVPMIIDWKRRAMYSDGLVYGTLEIDESGKETLKRIVVPEIEQWLRRSNIKRYIGRALKEWCTYENAFVQYSMSADRKSIASLYVHDSTECRLTLQNKDTGYIDGCQINANWDNGGTEEESFTLPCVDPYYDTAQQLREIKQNAIIHPLRDIEDGNKYYNVPSYYGIIESGWLEVARLIANFKRKLMDNAMSIKYHIKVNYEWWLWKYPDFETFTHEQRRNLMQDELENFLKIMKGTDNAGNAVLSTFKTDAVNGKIYEGWIIEKLDNNFKSGEHIDDIQEADTQAARALGVNPTIFGIAPGKGLSGGGGSEQRIVKMNFLIENKFTLDRMLEPLDVVAEYNGWNERYGGTFKSIVFWTKDFFAGTLDQGAAPKPQAA